MLDHLLLGDDDLVSLLLRFSRDDSALGAGPLGLEEAAVTEGDARAERARLRTHGYRRGHSRAWRGPEGDVALVTLYELRDAPAAHRYLLDGHDALVAQRVVVAPVRGLRTAWTATATDPDPSGGPPFVGHVVAFTHGAFHALVVVGGVTDRRRPSEARRVALAQHVRLVMLTT